MPPITAMVLPVRESILSSYRLGGPPPMRPSLVKPGREQEFTGGGETVWIRNPDDFAMIGAWSAFLVRVAFACRDQALQAVVDIETPCARAFVEALVVGNEALMGEADLAGCSRWRANGGKS